MKTEDDSARVPSSWARHLVLAITLTFAAAAVTVSCALVVYTAYLHDLRNGAFAIVFAVISTQIALSWLLWRDDPEAGPAGQIK